MTEKKKTKVSRRVWSLLLVLAMVISLIPLDVFQSNAEPGGQDPQGGTKSVTFHVYNSDNNAPVDYASIMGAFSEGEEKALLGNTANNGGWCTIENIPADKDKLYYSIKAYGVNDAATGVAENLNDVVEIKIQLPSARCIVDDGNVPLDGVKVSVEDLTTHAVKEYTSADGTGDTAKGVFTVENLVPGIDYKLTMQKEDHYSLTTSLTVFNLKSVNPIFSMNPKSVRSTDLFWNDATTFSDTVRWNTSNEVKRVAICTPISSEIPNPLNDLIVYYSDDDTIATVGEKTGIVTLKKPGDVVIHAKLPEDETYRKKDIEYTLHVMKAPRNTGIAFGSSSKSITMNDNGMEYPVTFTGSHQVTYSSSNENVATIDQNAKITVKSTGTTTLKAVIAGDDYYLDDTATCTLTVGTGDQAGHFEHAEGADTTIKYGQKGYQNKLIVDPLPIHFPGSRENPTYESSIPGVATVDSEGNITTKGVGTTEITAKVPAVEWNGKTFFKKIDLSYTLTVTKADQKVSFNNEVHEVAIGETYQNVATSVNINDETIKTNIAPTYSIPVEEDQVFATIDPDTGVVTPITAGGASGKSITVRATFAGSTLYNKKEEDYSLHIKRGQQTISFPEATYHAFVGDQSFNSPTLNKVGSGTGKVTYEIYEQKDEQGQNTNQIAKIDKDTGEITLNNNKHAKPGTVKVRATKAACADYEATSAEYTLTVEYDKVKEGDHWEVKVIGTPAIRNEWYSNKPENIYIACKNDFELCLEADRKDDPAEEVWSSELTGIIPEDGVYTIRFFIRDKASKSTAEVQEKVIKCDSTKPELEIAEKTKKISGWDQTLQIITFGTWPQDTGIDLEMIAEDPTSQLENLDYFIVENTVDVYDIETLDALYAEDNDPEHPKKDEEKTWKKLGDDRTIHADKDIHFIAYVRANDVAGNRTYQWTDGIVFESLKPHIDIVEKTSKVQGTDFYNTDVDYQIVVNDREGDKTPYSGLKEVKYTVVKTLRDGTTVAADENEILYSYDAYTEEENVLRKVDPADYNDGTLKFKYDNVITIHAKDYNCDNVQLIVTVTDLAGNVSTKTQDLKISIGKPEIEVTYNDKESPLVDTYEGTSPVENYYSKSRRATIVVTGRDSVWASRKAVIRMTEITDNSSDKPEYVFSSDDYDKQKGKTWTFNGWEYRKQETGNGDGDVHVATIDFTGDAKYKFTVEYVDAVGAEAEKYNSDCFVVDQKAAEEIVLTPSGTIRGKHGDANIYSSDVTVKIASKDQPFSRIKTVDYDIDFNGAKKESDTFSNALYTFNNSIVVDSAKFNTCDVRVLVTVKDYAGNVKQESIPLDIDVTNPTITVTYDNNDAHSFADSNGKWGYFPATRKAVVQITERSAHFDADAASKGITITAKDVKGKTAVVKVKDNNGKENDLELDEQACKKLLKGWSTRENKQDANQDVHTATINYTYDANYTFAITYTDKAGLPSGKVDTGESVAPYKFTVDTTAPTGTITIGKDSWGWLVKTLTFGIWNSKTVQISGTSDDITSPIASVDYYKTADTTAKTVTDLEKVEDWTKFTGFSVSPNERFVVYLRIRDAAGNTTYISSDGEVVDDLLPEVESINPEVTISPEQPVNGIYNTNVHTAIHVEDPSNGGSYSGLKQVRYEVLNLGEVTQSGVLYEFDIQNPTQGQLLQSFDGSITVDRALNNSNDVEIKVYAVDNAGNAGDASEKISIDITNPVINVTYDNNDGDTAFADGTTDAFFRATRTATITILERNFDPTKVVVTITNTDGTIPAISGWGTSIAGGNGDQTANTATITYSADGDYTFDISYVDQAGNANDPVNYSGLAPQKFTIDQTLPTVSVSYDNNDAANGNYFKAGRTATITVVEHNFETSRIQIPITASDNGAAKTAPAVSAWTSNGDTHVATINFEEDGLYGFDVEYNDKAGNVIADFEQQSFYVDLTNPVVEISKVVDESANNSAGNIGFEIQATDTNFDVFEPVVSVVIFNGNVFEMKKVDLGTPTDIPNGKKYTVENLDADGIYRITCTAADKAGNAYSEVKLTKEDGSAYTEERSGADTLITFSVNRKGSSFELDQNTMALTTRYYVKHVDEDVVVYEVNADPLQKYTLSLNGQDLAKDQYTVEESQGEGGWSKYTYTLNKALFENEGEYNLVVYSKDKAENDAFSDVKGASVKFVVDRTAPVVAVSGLENGARYQTERETVTLVPTDDGGALNFIRVILVDDNGNEIKELLRYEKEELLKQLADNDGKLNFDIDEGLYQNVRIICADDASGMTIDKASGAFEEANVYNQLFEDVSVTSNAFLIFWANRPLRWGVIIGIIALIAGAVVFVVMKRRKKESMGA